MTAKVRILATEIDSLTMTGAVEMVAEFIESRLPHRIITLNAEMAYLALKDQYFRQLVNTADMVTADGSGIIWAAKRMGTPLPERVTGIDLMQSLLAASAEKGYTVYFYGAAPGVAGEAAQKLKKSYPSLKIAGTAHGYLDEQEQKDLIKDIRSKKPDILFVALGAPRQEYWLAEHLAELSVPAAMGVGGSLDVLAGRVKRAPELWQKLKLEWLYRLLKDPKRYKRFLALPKFAWAVLTRGKI